MVHESVLCSTEKSLHGVAVVSRLVDHCYVNSNNHVLYHA